MNKVQKGLNKLINLFKSGMKTFPITLTLIIIQTIYAMVIIGNGNLEDILPSNIVMPFLIIFTFGVFFCETIFKRKSLKGIGTIASALISTLFIYILEFGTKYIMPYSIKISVKAEIILIIVGYIVALLLISLYMLYKKSNLTFQKFVSRIFSKICMITIVYLILNIGFMLLILVLTTLILENYEMYEIFPRIAIGIFGFFALPATIITIPSNKQEKDMPSFIKIISIYVFLPLFIIAIVILYIYILKILIINSIPSNFVYPILASTFAIGFIIWNLVYSYIDEYKVIKIFSKLLPYIFIPFIILQMYCAQIRFSAYGITPLRYVSYLYILLEIIVVFLMLYKKAKHIDKTLFVIIILTLIAVIPPFNMNKVSKISQSKILENSIKDNNMFVNNKLSFKNQSTENILKAKGAYNFLIKQYDSGKYIPSYLSDEDKDLFENNLNDFYEDDETTQESGWRYLTIFSEQLDLDISNYSRMSNVAISDSDQQAVNENQLLKQLEINTYLENLISKYYEETIIENKTFRSSDDNLLKINDSSYLYIEAISFCYDLDTSEIIYLDLKGNMFFK